MPGALSFASLRMRDDGDHADVWHYNERNELTGSGRYNTFDPNDPNNAYATNNLNQYTATTGRGTPTTPSWTTAGRTTTGCATLAIGTTVPGWAAG
jgi:hypothetical protein